MAWLNWWTTVHLVPFQAIARLDPPKTEVKAQALSGDEAPAAVTVSPVLPGKATGCHADPVSRQATGFAEVDSNAQAL